MRNLHVSVGLLPPVPFRTRQRVGKTKLQVEPGGRVGKGGGGASDNNPRIAILFSLSTQLWHTSVTSVKTHVPCECVQFDIRNPRKNKMRG